jgi:hypothetical protein
MNRLRISLILVTLTLVAGILAAGPVLAQQLGQPQPAGDTNVVAYDGQSLFNQSPDTQALFVGSWGAQANAVWVTEHNAQLVAAGYPIPIPSQPIAPSDQVGAQASTSSSDNDNSSSSDDNDNSSRGDDNDNNDNDGRDRPEVSLNVNPDRVSKGEQFSVHVSARDDHGITRITWWATGTDQNGLRDSHTHDCNGSDKCGFEWSEHSDGTGNFTIHARARDDKGHESDEASREVHVQ